MSTTIEPTIVRGRTADRSIQFSQSPRGGYRLTAAQFLPCSRDQVFEFFSDAFQLETLTPAFLQFKVLTAPPIRIQEGTLIDYRLRLHGIPLRWRSRISVWEPPFRFVDEQLRGPYRRWRHEHSFEEGDGGTLCRDIVDYSVWGGRPVEAIFVRPDVRRIFAFRQTKLQELFPVSTAVKVPTGKSCSYRKGGE